MLRRVYPGTALVALPPIAIRYDKRLSWHCLCTYLYACKYTIYTSRRDWRISWRFLVCREQNVNIIGIYWCYERNAADSCMFMALPSCTSNSVGYSTVHHCEQYVTAGNTTCLDLNLKSIVNTYLSDVFWFCFIWKMSVVQRRAPTLKNLRQGHGRNYVKGRRHGHGNGHGMDMDMDRDIDTEHRVLHVSWPRKFVKISDVTWW
jgi:hypothetical protein